jgi:hypothetical protein
MVTVDFIKPLYWDGKLIVKENPDRPDGAWIFTKADKGHTFDFIDEHGDVHSSYEFLYISDEPEDNYGWPGSKPLPLSNELNPLDELRDAVLRARKAGLEVHCHVIETTKTEL